MGVRLVVKIARKSETAPIELGRDHKSKSVSRRLKPYMTKKNEWPPETEQVVENLKDRIRQILETDEQAKSNFERFMERLHQTPDGSVQITREDAIELFAIYIVTKPVQDAIL